MAQDVHHRTRPGVSRLAMTNLFALGFVLLSSEEENERLYLAQVRMSTNVASNSVVPT